MSTEELCERVHQCLIDLSTPEGFNASGREEIFGCFFGRDSAITTAKILKVLGSQPNSTSVYRPALLESCRRSLFTLVSLAGRSENSESGEEPGKFIHEFRRDKYNHLTDWYIYPDGLLRNYDSLDSTPLGLIAIYKYLEITGDGHFWEYAGPAVEAGLDWIINYGDKDGDFLLEYEWPKGRTGGGLAVQSWTDSEPSLRQPDGAFPKYPIAPVEVQGYAWMALKLWADFFGRSKPQLLPFAARMKRSFNDNFIFTDGDVKFAAQALDGNKNPIRTVTGNPLLLLWATYESGSRVECIVEEDIVPDIVRRAFRHDLFHPRAGIRTMSSEALTFNPNQDSYHNGSFWPKLNGLAHEGLAKWRYRREADELKEATLAPLHYFGTPVELYVTNPDDKYLEFRLPSGQTGCREQAWSAAVALDLLST